MPLEWEAPATVKIHAGCGGRVRWVEDVDTPGVGYTGECLLCDRERIPMEAIVPVEAVGDTGGFKGEFDVREAVLDADRELLAGLEWDDDALFDENQRRLREEIVGEGVSA